MIEEFEEFRDNEPSFAGVPEEWSDEFMVHRIAGGVPTQEEFVLDNYTYSKAIRWMLFDCYEGYAARGGKRTETS